MKGFDDGMSNARVDMGWHLETRLVASGVSKLGRYLNVVSESSEVDILKPRSKRIFLSDVRNAKYHTGEFVGPPIESSCHEPHEPSFSLSLSGLPPFMFLKTTG